MAISKLAAAIIARGTSNAAFTQLTGCSVTRSGTTATLTKATHGLSNGNKVLIQGFSLEEFNGVFTISNVATNTFDYTISADPGANPSGSPGTVDLATVGTAVDMTTDAGGQAVVEIQNTTTGPTIAAQVWIGIATSSSEAAYKWRRLFDGSTVANEVVSQIIPLDPGVMYINFAVVRNTGQAVDCCALASRITGY